MLKLGKKYDKGKPEYSLLPPQALLAVVRVLTFGADKYGRDNWRNLPDAKRRYTDAFMRHTEAVRLGEVVDPESGYSHYAHAICCLMFLEELKLKGESDE